MFHKFAEAVTFKTKIALLPPVQLSPISFSQLSHRSIEGPSLPEIFPELRFASQPSWLISLCSLHSLPAKEQSGSQMLRRPEDRCLRTISRPRGHGHANRGHRLSGGAQAPGLRCCSDPNLEEICYASCVRQCGPPGSRAAVGFGTRSRLFGSSEDAPPTEMLTADLSINCCERSTAHENSQESFSRANETD